MAILRGHDNHSVLAFDEHVHKQHPAPRAEQEAQATPPPDQLGAHARKPFERLQRAAGPILRISRETVRDDGLVEVFDSGLRPPTAGRSTTPSVSASATSPLAPTHRSGADP